MHISEAWHLYRARRKNIWYPPTCMILTIHNNASTKTSKESGRLQWFLLLTRQTDIQRTWRWIWICNWNASIIPHALPASDSLGGSLSPPEHSQVRPTRVDRNEETCHQSYSSESYITHHWFTSHCFAKIAQPRVSMTGCKPLISLILERWPRTRSTAKATKMRFPSQGQKRMGSAENKMFCLIHRFCTLKQ